MSTDALRPVRTQWAWLVVLTLALSVGCGDGGSDSDVDPADGGSGADADSREDGGSAGPDRDGDGTPDDLDGCPDDADKTEPGPCGCGIAEGTCGEPVPQTLTLAPGADAHVDSANLGDRHRRAAGTR